MGRNGQEKQRSKSRSKMGQHLSPKETMANAEKNYYQNGLNAGPGMSQLACMRCLVRWR